MQELKDLSEASRNIANQEEHIVVRDLNGVILYVGDAVTDEAGNAGVICAVYETGQILVARSHTSSATYNNGNELRRLIIEW